MTKKPAPKAYPLKPDDKPAISFAGYTQVELLRSVSIAGTLYKPGAPHVVDAATLAAMGDAVAKSVTLR